MQCLGLVWPKIRVRLGWNIPEQISCQRLSTQYYWPSKSIPKTRLWEAFSNWRWSHNRQQIVLIWCIITIAWSFVVIAWSPSCKIISEILSMFCSDILKPCFEHPCISCYICLCRLLGSPQTALISNCDARFLVPRDWLFLVTSQSASLRSCLKVLYDPSLLSPFNLSVILVF